jgi:parallel beta-helix repeat protein
MADACHGMGTRFDTRDVGRTRCLRPLRRVLLATVCFALLPVLVRASPVRAVGQTTCPAAGIEIPASLSTAQVETLVNTPGPGRVFCWMPGVHRIRGTLVMHPGDTFLGISDPITGARPIIDGSVVRKHWARLSRTRWVAHVRGLAVPSIFLPPGGRCLDGSNHCAYPDDVFFGEKRLRRVWSLRAQGRGSYFVDYATNRIYIGRDPSVATISQSVPLPIGSWPQPLISALSGGTISGLTIEKCGVALQGAAIRGFRVTVTDVDVHFCHGWGLDVDDLSTVADSAVHSNGQGCVVVNGHLPLVIGAPGTVSGDQVYGNGWIRCWGICAGVKSSTTDGLSIINNAIYGNYGSGVWVDGNSINYNIQDNSIVDNRTAGVMLEISYDGVVQGNTILGSGMRPVEPIKVGAIHVLASGGCLSACPAIPTTGILIRQNTVGSTADPNAYGIVLRDQSRGAGPYGIHVVRDVTVVGNTITLCGTTVGPIASTFDGFDSGGDYSIYSSANTFEDNHYVITSAQLPAFRWQTAGGSMDGWLTFEQWQQAGMDTNDTPTLASC